MGHNKGRKPITIYSITALIVLITGGSLTIVGSFLHIDNWVKSGQEFRIGVAEQANLPAGEHVVFYQSHSSLPSDIRAIILLISDPNMERVIPQAVEINPDESYGPRTILPTNDIHGRMLWKFTAQADGWYTFRVENYHTDQDPENDRFVIGKSPPSFRTLKKRNNMVRIAGGSLTGAIFIGLYIMHGIALGRRKKTGGSTSAFVDYTPDL